MFLAVEGWVLFLAGLHEETQEEDLLDRFKDFGPVTNLHLNLDRKSGYAKGYAMVEFEEQEHAMLALEKLNGASICGNEIRIDWAFVRHETIPEEVSQKRAR